MALPRSVFAALRPGTIVSPKAWSMASTGRPPSCARAGSAATSSRASGAAASTSAPTPARRRKPRRVSSSRSAPCSKPEAISPRRYTIAFMARVGSTIGATILCAAAIVPVAGAADAPTPWDGSNPFVCELQQAGFRPTGPHPDADPYCIEFDKRKQNVDQLGVVDFLSNEPARVAAAGDKCFYFQSDHWRGSIVQSDASTKTYEWDGHYFFDKARSEGGAWVSNFDVNGQSGDPRDVPGFPAEWKPYFSKGTGGVITHNSVDGDPACAARAKREPGRIYRSAAGRPGSGARCAVPGGIVGRDRLGPVRIGDSEDVVRRSLGPPTLLKRGFLRYCLAGGGRFVVGELGDRSGDPGSSSDGRGAMVLSTSRGFRYGKVRPGSRFRRVRGLRKRFRYGNVAVYSQRRSAVLVGVRARKVRFIAVRNPHALRGRRPLATYLRRAG